jgi:hypothetical protein
MRTAGASVLFLLGVDKDRLTTSLYSPKTHRSHIILDELSVVIDHRIQNDLSTWLFGNGLQRRWCACYGRKIRCVGDRLSPYLGQELTLTKEPIFINTIYDI